MRLKPTLAKAAVGASGVAAATVALAGQTWAACTNTATTIADGASCSKGASQATNLFGANSIFMVVANTLVFIIGAVSVIYVIIGGLRYVTSSGDSKAVSAAKDTILYAVIGVVVAIISFALINFVITSISSAN